MTEEIIKMFNHITVTDFLVANPNSSSCNKAFKRIFRGTDFLKEFYIVSNKSFERLAEIAYVSNDITKNTVFITGYRGCGKTCFMNFLDKIIKGDYVLKRYNEYLNINRELIKDVYKNQRVILDNNYFYKEEHDEIIKLESEYKKSKKRIEVDLEAQLELYSKDDKKEISDYLNYALKGKSIYLNFETGMNSRNIPFNAKFIKQISAVINDIIRRKDTNHNPFSILFDLYQNNMSKFDHTFENKNEIYTFMKYLGDVLVCAERTVDVRSELDQKLNNMSLEQLIMVLVLLYISIEKCYGNKENQYNKIFLLFDNMDIIYRQTLLEQSMYSYSYFIENMNTLMEGLEESGEKEWSIIYENITFIFAMRETTSMQISGHFKDGMEQNVMYFDMSMDTNKSLIVEKKYKFLNNYKGMIENKVMVRIFEDVYRICTDYYTKENIFPMFNNDFKRSITCISKICQENKDILKQHYSLNKINKPFAKNGSRGIVYRLIYNKFKSEHYFGKIGIEPYHFRFTPARIILTILYNYLPDDENEDSERLMPENIDMKTLFIYARSILDTEMFINAILGMFSLRDEKMWNHLITFDNVKEVSYNGLKEYVVAYADNKTISSDIKLRITDAGKNYLKEICTHFEFFACRFCEQSLPLFCKENFEYLEEEDKYIFEKIIDDVFEAVKNCCNNLKISYNQKIQEKYKDISNKGLLTSKYVFRSKTEAKGILHEERIIHKHITYIDNFRIYTIKFIYPENCKEINKRIITRLKKYVNLLIDKEMSYKSKKLRKEFTECIKYIEDIKEWEDNVTEISEKSYKELRDKYAYNSGSSRN